MTTTSKLHTYRLIVRETGVHMGFVVIDDERGRCHINTGEFPAYSKKLAAFAFARVNDAICYALGSGLTLSVPLRTVGIGEGLFFDVVGF